MTFARPSSLHRFLLFFPPEFAHALAKRFLQLFQWLRFKVCKQSFTPHFSIHIPTVPTLRFASRVGIAAGLDKNAEFFAALGLFGAGFVEVGTVTPLPQDGNPKPRLWRPAPGTLINHMGFNSIGLDAFRKRVLAYRPYVSNLPVLANIGKNRETVLDRAVEDYRACFEKLRDCVDGFVVNLSSPNTPGLVQLQSEAFLSQIAGLVPVGMPVWVKLSPDLDNSAIAALGEYVARENRFSGIVLTNTSREMAEEVFGWDRGGLSGRPLFSRALECVSVARQAVGPHKTLIGVGGIGSLDSARQMRRAGADLVEIYTSFVYQGPALLKELSQLD